MGRIWQWPPGCFCWTLHRTSGAFLSSARRNCCLSDDTKGEISFWWIFIWKFWKWQLLIYPVIKITSKFWFQCLHQVSSLICCECHPRMTDISSWCKHFPCYWPFVRGIHITGEFPSQRPVTQSFDVFFDLHLHKWLSKQLWGWWFETPWGSLWCHCNVRLY